jgi:tetratricopeptide (TPR) repeat protein
LFDVNFEFSFAAENHERRCWYMAGVLMGLLRQGTAPGESDGGTRYVDDVIRAQRGIVEELALDGKLGCGPLVARSIYPHLIAVGETSLAARMAEVQGRRLSDAKRLALMNNILADGSRFLREGKLGEAQLLLQEALRGLSHAAKIAEGDPAYEAALRQALRKMGQCHQALGNFTEARSFLQMVVELRDCEERREALTDLGLITAGFKSLRSIIPGKDPLGWPTLIKSLNAGKTIFEQAIEKREGEEVRGVRNAHLALGLCSILARPPNAKAAVDHLERAYAGMLRRREAYVSGNVLDWTRFLLALSHLEQLDPAFAAKARELIEESIEVGDQFSIQLWQRCLDAAAMLDDATLCQRIVEYLFERRAGEVFTAIRGSSALLKSELLRRRYNEMLVGDKRLSILERFAEWKALLRICQQEGDSELAAEILGQLEEFALREGPLCGEFEALLASPNGYSPGWDSEDAEMSRARVLENMGRLPEAATIYARWFYALTEKGSEHCVAQAREFLEKAKKLGGEVGLGEMESRLAACEDALNVIETNTGAEAELRKGAKVSLLYVGGNEIQEAFDEKIAQRLNADYPGLQIEFYHPGWSSNWNRSLDDVKRLIPEAEAILLSPLVRTQFGRNLRKFCNASHPWFASTAKGQSGIRESIRRIAIATLARRSPTRS